MSLYNIKGERNSVSFISKLKYEWYRVSRSRGSKGNLTARDRL